MHYIIFALGMVIGFMAAIWVVGMGLIITDYRKIAKDGVGAGGVYGKGL